MSEADEENLRQWLEDEAGAEPIEAVVIGAHGDDSKVPDEFRNRLLMWDEAKSLLDYGFDDGYGAAGCDAVYAWTPTKVLFIREYDGSTQLGSIPRHPVACEPTHA